MFAKAFPQKEGDDLEEERSKATECCICLDNYDTDGNKRPVGLVCGHSTCKTCFDTLKNKSCPTCRQISPQNIPFNIGLINLIAVKCKPPPITKEMVADKIKELEVEAETYAQLLREDCHNQISKIKEEYAQKQKADEQQYEVMMQDCQEEISQNKQKYEREEQRRERELHEAILKLHEDITLTKQEYENEIRERDRTEKERFDQFVRKKYEKLLDEISSLRQKMQETDDNYCESYQKLLKVNHDLKEELEHCDSGWKKARDENRRLMQDSFEKQAKIDRLEAALKESGSAKPVADNRRIFLWNDKFKEYFGTELTTIIEATKMLQYKIQDLPKYDGKLVVADAALQQFVGSDKKSFEWSELQKALMSCCIREK